ncbi:phosphatase PAP2 family protein [Deefgea rivuli]|uniref:phosphatase PAP2 family protein n=1 Tax=Deefgea rivuli TaxID=400948 RepID=UPI0006860F10|nr:phosphatase PAP2 family protein [Deefgea rivuli]
MRNFSLRHDAVAPDTLRRLKWLAFSGFICLLLLTALIDTPVLNQLDQTISDALYNAHPAWIAACKLLAALASFPISLLIALGFSVWFCWRDRAAALGLPLAVIGSWSVAGLIKYSVLRPRPELLHLAHANSPSFPSGHSMVAWALPFILALIFSQRQPTKAWRFYGAALSIALICGLARVGLGVHHFSDVLAGYSAAMLIVAGFAVWYTKYQHRFSA